MTGLAGEGARTNFKRAGGDDVVGWQLAGACRADVKDDNQIIPTTKFLVDTNNSDGRFRYFFLVVSYR